MYQIPEINKRFLKAKGQGLKAKGETINPSPLTLSQKKTKQQEFPNIRWDETLNHDVQLCILLYNERVTSHQKMQQMLAEVDDTGTLPADFGKQFARLDDSNRAAHRELEHYNRTGEFLHCHPITV